jgi:broad specificity phosphatase PhoE
MTLYLVRHAQAGSRSTWVGNDDRDRPLTSEGRHQVADLVGTIAEFPVTTVYTSPFLRCVETAAPIAARLGLTMVVTEALAEGPVVNALSLARKVADQHAVFVSHGDIIPGLLDSFARSDGLDLGSNPRCQKCSVWIVEPNSETCRYTSAAYLPPPR